MQIDFIAISEMAFHKLIQEKSTAFNPVLSFSFWQIHRYQFRSGSGFVGGQEMHMSKTAELY